MQKNTTVKDAAEKLNVPVETLISWIEQGVIQENGNRDRDQFIEQIETGELSGLISYYQQKNNQS